VANEISDNKERGLSQEYNRLYSDACVIIENARLQAYRAVNTALTLRNWKLGERIAKKELEGAERAEYGKHIITTLTKELTTKYGKGFDTSTLYRYILFYRMFPKIVASLRPQSEKVDAVRPQLLPWTHYRELML